MTCTIDDTVIDARARLGRAVAALELIGTADIESLDRAALDDVVAARRVVVAFCSAVDVRVARRARQLADEGRSESAAEALREHGKRSAREAAAAAERERACEELPSFEDALAEAAISDGHLDAVASATAKLNEEQKAEFASYEPLLLGRARNQSVEEFSRGCRHLANVITTNDDGECDLERQRAKNNIKQWIDRTTGMGHLHAELDPESHAKIWAAINARLRTLKHQQQEQERAGDDTTFRPLAHEQLEAQALIDLIIGSGALDKRVPEVIVLIDWDTLLDGLRADSVCETSAGVDVPPATVRRWCCDANIIPVVLGGDGEVLDVGAGSRLATQGQRRAMMAMYSTCCFPGCTTPVDRCEIHHVDEWLHTRRTDLGRLAPLCCRHHHVVHEGGWQLTMAGDRTITITRPDGTHYFTGRTTDRRTTSPTA